MPTKDAIVSHHITVRSAFPRNLARRQKVVRLAKDFCQNQPKGFWARHRNILIRNEAIEGLHHAVRTMNPDQDRLPLVLTNNMCLL